MSGSDAQKILHAMEDETTSLLCLGDGGSRLSHGTGISEISTSFSTSFPFDSEILASKIYQVAHRSYLRQISNAARTVTSSPVGSMRRHLRNRHITMMAKPATSDESATRPPEKSPRVSSDQVQPSRAFAVTSLPTTFHSGPASNRGRRYSSTERSIAALAEFFRNGPPLP